MALESIYSSMDDVPDDQVNFRDLFSERNGKAVLTGIGGLATQDDIQRLTLGAEKEREEHKATKERLSAWEGLDPEEVHRKLDSYPELLAASKGKLNDDEIQAAVERRLEGTLTSRTAPLERELRKVKQRNAELEKLGEELQAEKLRMEVNDETMKAVRANAVRDEAVEDVLMHAERIFEKSPDGQILTRDGVGVTPGISPESWLKEALETKVHWAKDSYGGEDGTGGPPRRVPGGFKGDNPWAYDTWNVTKQAEFHKTYGDDKASDMAKRAGTSLGGLKPRAPR